MGARSNATYPSSIPFTDSEATAHLYGITYDVVSKAVDTTITENESGKIILSTGDDKTMTLPSTATGLVYTFVVGATSTSTGLSISPAAADSIGGLGLTTVDDKDLINTQATERVGDSVTLVSVAAGWLAINASGTWAKEA